MKKAKKIFTAILAAFCMLAAASCGEKKSDTEYIKEKNVLRVGITIYEPMDYYNEDETDFIGFDADLARGFAAEMGVEVKFVLITWANKIAELKSKEIDCIWNGMTASETLAQSIDLSLSYATNNQCVVVKSENIENFETIAAVKNASKIAVENGSAGNTVCEETLGLSTGKIAAVTAQVDALTEVAAGTAEIAIVDYTLAYSVVGKGAFSSLSIVDISKVSFDNEEFAVGFRKGSDLTNKANEYLKKCYKDGTLKSLTEKYSGVALNESALQ